MVLQTNKRMVDLPHDKQIAQAVGMKMFFCKSRFHRYTRQPNRQDGLFFFSEKAEVEPSFKFAGCLFFSSEPLDLKKQFLLLDPELEKKSQKRQGLGADGWLFCVCVSRSTPL